MNPNLDVYQRRGQLCLPAGALLSLRPLRAARLRVLSGRAWVTQAGDSRDHFVFAGGLLVLAPRCRTVLQADGGELVFALDARNAADGKFWQAVQHLLPNRRPGAEPQAAARVPA